MVRPYICTCDGRLDVFKKFVESYVKYAKPFLEQPIVYYSGDGEEYHKLIDLLDPIEKIDQGSVIESSKEASIDYKCIWEFPEIIAKSEVYKKEFILFLEDDIIFSSKFHEAIEEVEEHAINYGVVDVTTLFGHNEEYWPEVNNKANWYIYKFDGSNYHGNLAVMFRPELMEFWLQHREQLWADVDEGWDWKIGTYFQSQGKGFYCTHHHYVQHQVGYSVISDCHKHEVSYRFVK